MRKQWNWIIIKKYLYLLFYTICSKIVYDFSCNLYIYIIYIYIYKSFLLIIFDIKFICNNRW